jgi:signal transduction histidine kinase
MKSKNIVNSSYWWLTALITLVVGISATIYTGLLARRNIQNSLLQRTDSMAGLVPTDTLSLLSGSENDLSHPGYRDLKARLTEVRSINRDIRFIYLLANKNDNHENSYFIVDSEDPQSEDYSPPGQLYPEGDADVADIYETKKSTVLPITRDRWGIWLSAFSPVKDRDGNVIAVLGLDIDAYNYYRDIVLSAIVPFLLTIMVLMALVWSRRRARYQQQFLEEKAFFLSFASHEIRSPLASVAWALQALLSGTMPQDKIVTFMKRTEQSVRSILATIEDVLNLQSTEALKSKKLQLTEEKIHDVLVQTAESLSLISAEKGVEVKDLTDTSLYNFTANIDISLFKRVLSNLLVNALKYSPKQQVVTIALSAIEKGWAIEFHNEGAPISEADKAKIFKGYYRTKDAQSSGQKGTGLGLMLARDIISRHGGILELADAKQGVTFRISMPKK